MQFFRPPERQRRPEQPVMPEWFGPPVYEVGQLLPVAGVVARSDAAAVVLQSLVVYSNGFQAVIAARVRDADPWIDVIGRGAPPWERTGDLPDTFLRLGLELPDGRKATNLDRKRPDLSASPELVFMVGGGGGGAVWDFRAWVWPLPPPQPFDLVCEWPGVSIPFSRYPLDGEAIRVAAARSAPIWEPT